MYNRSPITLSSHRYQAVTSQDTVSFLTTNQKPLTLGNNVISAHIKVAPPPSLSANHTIAQQYPTQWTQRDQLSSHCGEQRKPRPHQRRHCFISNTKILIGGEIVVCSCVGHPRSRMFEKKYRAVLHTWMHAHRIFHLIFSQQSRFSLVRKQQMLLIDQNLIRIKLTALYK